MTQGVRSDGLQAKTASVPYTPLAIANSFIAQFGHPDGIEHLKLQKLVYCAYGWWLALHGLGSARLTTEGPEVWRYGPVFDSLYHALKVFGRRGISEPQSLKPLADPENVGHGDVRRFVAWIWGRYGHLSSSALSEMTHKAGTPWHRMATENDFRIANNTKIPDAYILEEFAELLNAAANAAARQAGSRDGQEQEQSKERT